MEVCPALEAAPQAAEHEFYGDGLLWLEGAAALFLLRLDLLRRRRAMRGLRDPVEHYKARIKSADSMRAKLRRQKLPETAQAALSGVFDAVGVRIVCPFVDDIDDTAALIREMDGLTVVQEKDYVRRPKPNGYRSYHMILRVPLEIAGELREPYLEVQLRTIAMDCWACLEHQIKYKRDVPGAELLVRELKRCAEDLASDDLSMQTIRELIAETLQAGKETS